MDSAWGPAAGPPDDMDPDTSANRKRKAPEEPGPPPRKLGPVKPDFLQDRLRKLVANLSSKLTAAASWEKFVSDH